MIFAESRVSGPHGAIEARMLKPGDPVYSWDGRNWRRNEVAKVNRGQSKTAYSIFSFDGTVPMHIRCAEDQLFRVKGAKNLPGKMLRAGQAVLVSEGAHVFRAQIGAIEMALLDAPQPTFGVELKRLPRNILVEGFILRADGKS